MLVCLEVAVNNTCSLCLPRHEIGLKRVFRVGHVYEMGTHGGAQHGILMTVYCHAPHLVVPVIVRGRTYNGGIVPTTQQGSLLRLRLYERGCEK